MKTLMKTTALAALGALLLSTTAVQAQDARILGVSLPNLTNPYYVAMKKSFEENATAQGFQPVVLIADNDDAKQLSQVQSLIQQGAAAVALNCVSSGPCVASVAELNAANIPVFTINILPDPESMAGQNLHMEQGVQTDQKAGGTYIGEQLLKDKGADAKLVIGYELDAIAAVVIGGTSLTGGVGRIGYTLIGVLMIGIISNGLDLMGVSSYFQQIIKGSIIVLARPARALWPPHHHLQPLQPLGQGGCLGSGL